MTLADAAGKVGGALLLTAVIVAVLDPLTSVLGAGVSNQTANVDIRDGSGEIASGSTSVDTVYTVNQSLGTAVELTGAADSEVDVGGVSEIPRTFSACIYAEVDSNATDETLAILSYDELAVTFNGSADAYRAWYYNESSRDSYEIRVDSVTPADPTLVCVDHDGQNLTIYRNTTKGTTAESTTDNVATAPNGSNFDGVLEELRLFGGPLNDSQRQAMVNEPTRGLPNASHTARVMFDARGQTDSVATYWTGGTTTLSNATIVAGFPGEDLSDGGVLSSGDYSIDGDTLVAHDGGKLDGAPVAFVSFRAASGSVVTPVINTLPGVLGILVVIVLGYAASMVTGLFDDF